MKVIKIETKLLGYEKKHYDFVNDSGKQLVGDKVVAWFAVPCQYGSRAFAAEVPVYFDLNALSSNVGKIVSCNFCSIFTKKGTEYTLLSL